MRIVKVKPDQYHLLQQIAKIDATVCPTTIPIDDWAECDWYVAYIDGEIAGFSCKKELGEVTYLKRSGVLPKYRGRGIQKKMIERRIKDAESSYVITYTMPWNIISSNNLIKKGFMLYSPETEWAGDDVLYFKYERPTRTKD